MAPIDAPNPYAAPQAELNVVPTTGATSPSLQDAINGRYTFTIGGVMDEAWLLVKGMKASFWGAAIVIALIYLVFEMICAVILAMFLGGEPNAVVRQLTQGVVSALMTPFTMGLQMMCVRRALGMPVSFSTAFSYFPRAGVALGSALLVMLLTWVGMVMLVIPGIYLMVAYSLTTQLVCDRELSAWDAMETSRSAITHKWWRVFGLHLLVGLLMGLSMLALLIPLIWTVPWAMMTSAVLYKRIFYSSAPPEGGAAAPVGSTG